MLKHEFLKYALLLIITICTCVILGGCSHNKESITKEDGFIEIANTKMHAMEVDIEEKHIIYDHGNFFWERELVNLAYHIPQAYKKYRSLLNNKNYQTIIYYPKNKMTLGGVYWVFIDLETKKVISVHTEQ